MKIYKLSMLCLGFIILIRCTNRNEMSDLQGPYLGQNPPGMTPEIFAPGIVSTERNEHSPAIFSKDGKNLFWSYYYEGEHVIMHTCQKNGFWSSPVKFESSQDLKDGNPFFSSDWKRLFFHSARRGNRPDGSQHIDFWVVQKEDDSWSEPKCVDFPPNNNHWNLYGCQTADGDFYYTSKLDESSKSFLLFYSRYNGRTWEEGIPMPAMFNSSDVNWTPYVSPDESYLIFSSDRNQNADGYDACDLFVSFKEDGNAWSQPVPFGEEINTNVIERFPWVSPDGKYLFFVRGFGDVYWVDAKVIDTLKLKTLK